MVRREIGLEMNADNSKYMVMSRDQNAGRSHSMKTDNSSVERAEVLKLLKTLTNQNSILEEFKSRFEVRECMLSFGAESLIFQFAIQKFKD